jgi:hypothetical protein
MSISTGATRVEFFAFCGKRTGIRPSRFMRPLKKCHPVLS